MTTAQEGIVMYKLILFYTASGIHVLGNGIHVEFLAHLASNVRNYIYVYDCYRRIIIEGMMCTKFS